MSPVQKEPLFLTHSAVQTLQASPPVGILHLLTDRGQFEFAITGEAARDVAAKLLAFANQAANDGRSGPYTERYSVGR